MVASRRPWLEWVGSVGKMPQRGQCSSQAPQEGACGDTFSLEMQGKVEAFPLHGMKKGGDFLLIRFTVVITQIASYSEDFR